jgi:hypothetical protein
MTNRSPDAAQAEEPLAEEPPRDTLSGWLLCSYCREKAEFLEISAEFYQGRDFGPVWACRPCGAWVGCHPGTGSPLGRLAKKDLRDAKILAHAAFDPLWKAAQRRDGIKLSLARTRGYRWLAEQLGIDKRLCHIGNLSLEGCRRVVEICAPYQRKAKSS